MKLYSAITIAAAAVISMSCQTGQKAAPLTGYPQVLGAVPYLTGGYNHSPIFSLDESKVFFISKGRKDHRNNQVYEYDHSIRTQRRITFQDGDVHQVAAGPEQKIFYASNTDEIKEGPFVRDLDPQFPRAELYISDPYGDEIERLTETPGFDGEMIYVPSNQKLLFTSMRDKIAGIYWIDADKKITPFQVGKYHQRSATIAPDYKTVYWVEVESPKKQAIFKGSTSGPERILVTSVAGSIKSLTANAAGLIAYAWKPKGDDFTQINLLNPETNCNRVLLKSEMDFLHPKFSAKNSNVLLFSGILKENSVVYRWELPEALGPCVR